MKNQAQKKGGRQNHKDGGHREKKTAVKYSGNKAKFSKQDNKKKPAGNHQNRPKDKSHGKKDSGKEKSDKSNNNKSNTATNYKAHKPHYKLVENLKYNWNIIRDRKTSPAERQNIVKKMMDGINNKVLDVTLRHDASRIVQTILQFGNEQQREKMLAELLTKFFEVAKTPYGHFTVLKAATYCTSIQDRKRMAASLSGHFVSLGTHVIGARTVETICQLFPPQVSRGLKAEFYGKNFVVLTSEPPKSLQELIIALPNKRENIIDHMRDLIHRFNEKGLLEFTYVHNIIFEYVSELFNSYKNRKQEENDGVEVNKNKDLHRLEELASLFADSVPKLMSTKYGSKAAAILINFSNAKDRKRMIKSLKGHCLESLLHDSAYLALVKLIDVTDDTVNVQKSLLEEIVSKENKLKYTATGEDITARDNALVAIAKHKHAHKLLVRLLVPQLRHFEPDEEVCFDETVAAPHSKKSAEQRRREHLVYLKQHLLRNLSGSLAELARHKYGFKVVEAISIAFRDRNFLDNLARVYCGFEVNETDIAADEEFEEEVQEEEEDAEEDDEMDVDDADGDEDEEEHEGGDEGSGEGGGEGGDEDEEAFEQDDEYLEQLDEVQKDIASAMQSTGKAEKSSKPDSQTIPEVQNLLPIEEDVVAHILLKKLIKFETALERKQSAIDTKLLDAVIERSKESVDNSRHSSEGEKYAEIINALDATLWTTNDDEQQNFFSDSLCRYLVAAQDSGDDEDSSDALLFSWLAKNRSAHAILELLHLPSVALKLLPNENTAADEDDDDDYKKLRAILNQAIDTFDESSRENNSGVKKLVGFMNVARDVVESKKKKIVPVKTPRKVKDDRPSKISPKLTRSAAKKRNQS